MLINRDDAIAAYMRRRFGGSEEVVSALRALPVSDGVTDEMVNAAYDAWMNYDGSKNWDTRDVLRLALEAALGPLPAPPSE